VTRKFRNFRKFRNRHISNPEPSLAPE